MLYKNKNIDAKQKNQNGGLIQDGDENIFLKTKKNQTCAIFKKSKTLLNSRS
jgi:hypothetical protein